MEKYIPDIYQKSIYAIDYNKLYKRGIKCILFEIENTLVSSKKNEIDSKLKELFLNIKKIGINPIIFASCNSKRVNIFTSALEVEGYSKAYSTYSEKINNILKKYKEDEIALIGDKMIPNIVYGNKCGITTVLVNPISTKASLKSFFRRRKENYIMTKLRDNNLFVKGRYYE